MRAYGFNPNPALKLIRAPKKCSKERQMFIHPNPRQPLQEIFMSIPQRNSSFLTKALIGFGVALMFSGAAFAQNHTSEAAPQTNTKPQAAAEAKRSAKPAGVKPIKDGSTSEGEGSAVKKTSRPEARAQEKAAVRETRPHRDPSQGGTPK
ncbi:hypothetical protein VCH24_63010 [Variovorax boronicumulans]|jgi:hypothetical protein|nr:hypothetical protein VCH24_63010 [Variovorax boronicumulans]